MKAGEPYSYLSAVYESGRVLVSIRQVTPLPDLRTEYNQIMREATVPQIQSNKQRSHHAIIREAGSHHRHINNLPDDSIQPVDTEAATIYMCTCVLPLYG